MANLVAVGRVVRAHGLRGELVIVSDGDSLLALGPEDSVWLGDPPEAHSWLGARLHKGRVLLSVHGIDDRSAAEAMRGAVVQLAEDRRRPLADGEAFVEDFSGCRLLDPTGRLLGRVVGVVDSGAHDLLELDTPSGTQFVPMTRDWLVELRLQEGVIVMQLPEGLLAGDESEG